ncbi:NADH oxidase [Apiospora arundinis]
MVAVLRSGVDGLGIGRAACQEPDLPLKLLSGKASGIMKYAMGEDDAWARIGSAVVQIQQMARGEEPVDLTNAENAQKIMAMLAAKRQESL